MAPVEHEWFAAVVGDMSATDVEPALCGCFGIALGVHVQAAEEQGGGGRGDVRCGVISPRAVKRTRQLTPMHRRAPASPRTDRSSNRRSTAERDDVLQDLPYVLHA